MSAILFFVFSAAAQTTNALSDAEIQGRKLAQQLCETRPTENFTNIGVLQIQDGGGNRLAVAVTCKTIVTAADWRSVYEANLTNQMAVLFVIHTADQPNIYFYKTNSTEQVPLLGDIPVLGHLFRNSHISGEELTSPFAGSDFCIADLGLEFFHWPEQKIVKREFARGRGCMVLESTNPNPSPNGYSRVDSWIDEESLGIVQAKACDANGKLLKEFYPKDFKKVNGQWQVGSMEIDNVQTRSRTRIEFDLKSK